MARFDGKVALVSGRPAASAWPWSSGWRRRAPPWSGATSSRWTTAYAATSATRRPARRPWPPSSNGTVASTCWPTWPASASPAPWAPWPRTSGGQVIDVNLTGTFLLSQSALAALLESRGVIVNMASVAGLRATPYNAAYCASKGGVIMLTKSMAIELAKAGVRVNAVCPASVDTPFLRGFEIPDGADMSLFARAASPMGRLVDVAEVAAAVAYLASDEAATISGTTLVIDGAATA